MRLGFEYEFWLGDEQPRRTRNLITYDGQLALLQKIFAESGGLYSGGNARTTLYIGLCDTVPSRALELSGVTTEPEATVGGYERKAWQIGRSASDNTFRRRNDFAVIDGPVITFEASGADFSRTVRRFFMTTASDTTDTGILISVSGPLPEPVQIADGDAGLSVRPSLSFFN